MKTKSICLSIIATCVFLFHGVAVSEEPKLRWYTVTIHEGSGTRGMIGTSVLDEAALCKACEGSSYILIENLIYFDQNRQPKKWSDWTKYDAPRVYLNPKEVISVMPLLDDPFKIAAENKEK